MLLLTPRMPVEAPPTYVSFVERHLPSLRRDAALLVGDGRRADDFYPEVLADVAGRWRMIELLRTRFRRTGVAEAFLRRAFARRAKLWHHQQITPVEVHVWSAEWAADPHPTPPPPLQKGSRLGREFPTELPFTPADRCRAALLATRPAPARASSLALRLAPVLPGNQRPELAALAEAAIAWWHAYRAARRRRYVIACGILAMMLGMLSQVPEDADSYLRSGPTLVSVPWSWSAPAPVPGCSTTTNCPIIPLSS